MHIAAPLNLLPRASFPFSASWLSDCFLPFLSASDNSYFQGYICLVAGNSLLKQNRYKTQSWDRNFQFPQTADQLTFGLVGGEPSPVTNSQKRHLEETDTEHHPSDPYPQVNAFLFSFFSSTRASTQPSRQQENHINNTQAQHHHALPLPQQLPMGLFPRDVSFSA